MFTFTREQIRGFDPTKAVEFVSLWQQYYSPDTTRDVHTNEEIDYVTELHLGNELNETNVKRLLRWKDRRLLTETILTGANAGAPNHRVAKVLRELSSLNEFRAAPLTEATENAFLNLTGQIFETGIVWRAFLFHIARPHEYPIADRYVFRAFSTWRDVQDTQDWAFYQQFKTFFFELAAYAHLMNDHADITGKVAALKPLDDALFAFGKFLESYDVAD